MESPAGDDYAMCVQFLLSGEANLSRRVKSLPMKWLLESATGIACSSRALPVPLESPLPLQDGRIARIPKHPLPVIKPAESKPVIKLAKRKLVVGNKFAAAKKQCMALMEQYK